MVNFVASGFNLMFSRVANTHKFFFQNWGKHSCINLVLNTIQGYGYISFLSYVYIVCEYMFLCGY